MHQIVVDDIVIDVERKRIKNLHLTVYPQSGRVRISVPTHVMDEAVRLYAISKLSWIKKHQTKFLNQGPKPEKKYLNGEIHYFRGKTYLLNLVQHTGHPKIVIRDGFIDMYVKEDSTLKQREDIIVNWYREFLREQIPALIEKWQKVIGVEVNYWNIKKMKTRWGTCNRVTKRIWLSLDLAERSDNCLEYILVHEMVHLLEIRHNGRFSSLMDRFLPFWRDYKKELRSP